MDTTSDRNAKVEDFLNQLKGIIRLSLVQSLQDSKKFPLVTTDRAAAKAAGQYVVCRSDVQVHFGSTAARLLVGMGAGRSKLIEVVSLDDPRTGEVFLKYTGWGGAIGGFGSQILGKMRVDAFEIGRYFSTLVPSIPARPGVSVHSQETQAFSPPPLAAAVLPSPVPVRGADESTSHSASADTLLIKGLGARKQAGQAADGKGVWTLTGMIVNPTSRSASQASLVAVFIDQGGAEVHRDQQVFPLSRAAQESAFAWKVNAVPASAEKVRVRVVGATWGN